MSTIRQNLLELGKVRETIKPLKAQEKGLVSSIKAQYSASKKFPEVFEAHNLTVRWIDSKQNLDAKKLLALVERLGGTNQQIGACYKYTKAHSKIT